MLFRSDDITYQQSFSVCSRANNDDDSNALRNKGGIEQDDSEKDMSRATWEIASVDSDVDSNETIAIAMKKAIWISIVK